LCFAAAVGHVRRASCDFVALEVAGVAAAARMQSQDSGSCHGPNEEPKSIEDVKCQHDDGMELKVFAEGGRGEVDQGQHCEDGDEHVEVDNGWIGPARAGNHAANECHDDDGAEELEAS